MRYQYDEIGFIIAKDDAGTPVGSVPEDDASLQAWLAGGSSIEAHAPTREQLLVRVNELRDRHLNGGFSWGNRSWDSDQRSRDNLSGAVASVAAQIPLPAGFAWRTAHNVDLPMTASDLVSLGAAMFAHVNACYVKSWDLKAQLAAAADPSTVDLESGWPSA